MKQLFVIGDPVAHSLSPLLHQAMLDQTGAAYRYDVRTVRLEELSAFVRWAKDGGCAGFNVTMPHKEAILPLLDEVDATAASCGAVNTGKFCSNCGGPKPASDEWTCECGTVNKGKFCANCGTPRT